jgi:hypothetical protein
MASRYPKSPVWRIGVSLEMVTAMGFDDHQLFCRNETFTPKTNRDGSRVGVKSPTLH